MSEERRYQDEEIRAIFGAAAQAPETADRAIAAGGGLTLSELKEIGTQVGIAPERVTAAALALDRPPPVPARRSVLGLPLAVGRTVDLPRALDDREWAILLGELRQTFGARGRAETHGELREWTNGNLHAYVEPTETGYRLRLGTMKGTTFPLLTAGLAAMSSGLYGWLASGPAEAMAGPAVMVAFGGAAIGGALLRQAGWAREREQQMDYIVSRVQALLESGPPDRAD
jgi:hypothetical protein